MKYCVVSLLLISQMTRCEIQIPRAYQIIADQYGIPALVFFSLAMQESGKTKQGKYLPWPWTLNIDDKPYYYSSREEAEFALITTLDRARMEGKVGRVAVGLGQIYMPAHIENFESPLQALDPTYNLNYAAQLLLDHYVKTWVSGNPNWWVAVGMYHSPYKQDPAKRYRMMVYKRCERMSNRCFAFGDPDAVSRSGAMLGAR